MSALFTNVDDRRLVLDGTLNTRDVGGYRLADGTGMVAVGALYRSDGLHALGTDARRRVAAAGIRSVIDLRSDDERADRPSALAGLDLTVHEIPIGAGRLPDEPTALPTLAEAYRSMIADEGASFARAIELLAHAEHLPAILHCTAGKDRTGISIAFVHDLLGVDDADIIGDYEASERLLGPAFRDLMLAALGELGMPDDQLHELMDDMLASPAELIVDVLRTVRESHGSVERYLVAHGLTSEAIEQLRSNLVVDPEPLSGATPLPGEAP